jgi:hypothetical protein
LIADCQFSIDQKSKIPKSRHRLPNK